MEITEFCTHFSQSTTSPTRTPRLASRLLLLRVGLIVTFARAVHGGGLSANFDDGLVPPGANVYGSASVAGSGGVGNSGVLALTPAALNQEGSFIIDDLDPGSRVNGFFVAFNLHMGNGTAVPADGISFNFATDLASGPFNEEGSGSGLTITFDAYDNSTGDNTEGPEIRIKYGGNLVARRKISNQFQTGVGYAPVSIS